MSCNDKKTITDIDTCPHIICSWRSFFNHIIPVLSSYYISLFCSYAKFYCIIFAVFISITFNAFCSVSLYLLKHGYEHCSIIPHILSIVILAFKFIDFNTVILVYFYSIASSYYENEYSNIIIFFLQRAKSSLY